MNKVFIAVFIGILIVISGCTSNTGKIINPLNSEDRVDNAIERIYKNDPARKVIGKEAPDFTVKDLLTDKIYTKKDFSGKLLVINSFATWCASCAEEIIKFDKIKGIYGDKVDIIYIGVDPGETKEKVINLLRRIGGKGGWIFTTDQKMLNDYGIYGVDITFMVKDGKFIYGDSLVAPFERLNNIISKALED